MHTYCLLVEVSTFPTKSGPGTATASAPSWTGPASSPAFILESGIKPGGVYPFSIRFFTLSPSCEPSCQHRNWASTSSKLQSRNEEYISTVSLGSSNDFDTHTQKAAGSRGTVST